MIDGCGAPIPLSEKAPATRTGWTGASLRNKGWFRDWILGLWIWTGWTGLFFSLYTYHCTQSLLFRSDRVFEVCRLTQTRPDRFQVDKIRSMTPALSEAANTVQQRAGRLRPARPDRHRWVGRNVCGSTGLLGCSERIDQTKAIGDGPTACVYFALCVCA